MAIQIENLKNSNVRYEAELKKNELSIDTIKDKDIIFNTGFPSRGVVDAVFEWLDTGNTGENIQLINFLFRNSETHERDNLKRGRPYKLLQRNQFLLFLCRVWLGLLEYDLSYHFNKADQR